MPLLRIAGLAFGALAFVLVAFLVIGFLLPSEWRVERSAWIGAPPEEVFPYLDRAEAWSLWTPSPPTGVELFGPPAGPGSGRRWDDPGYGTGEFEITESTPPEAIEYRVDVEGGSIRIRGSIRLEREEEGTRLHWEEEGDFGWNPLLGYLAGRMGELQGGQLESALEFLRRLVEEGTALPEGPEAAGRGATPGGEVRISS
jgi:uncharacterized protein YndB with AHSA1/START domain